MIENAKRVVDLLHHTVKQPRKRRRTGALRSSTKSSSPKPTSCGCLRQPRGKTCQVIKVAAFVFVTADAHLNLKHINTLKKDHIIRGN
ncbi:hypothetical protein quinque_006106 [Culex quinquefasciatus]